MKMAFVGGFPDGISMELQRLAGIENMEAEEVLRHARGLAKLTSELEIVATSSKSKPGEEE